VAVINETMARRFWPNQDPIGKRVRFVRLQEVVEIVGVVGDVRRFDIGSAVDPEIYWPYLQKPRWAIYFTIRTSVDPLGVVPAVRSRVAGLDRDVLVSNVWTVDRLVSVSLTGPRFNLLVLGSFAVVALLLASVGIYGVIAYSVAQRTREIGIRMALGARSSDVLRLVVGQGMVLTLIGVAIGVAAAFGLTRLMASLLFGVGATDPLTFALVALLLTGVALLACYLPARRAARVDPMMALRHK